MSQKKSLSPYRSETERESPTLDVIQVIESTQKLFKVDWKELWYYRELFGFLVWRDIKVKYKQTLLGAAWAILVPFAQMVIFTIIFGKVANLSTEGIPGPLFYYAALLPWTYFAQSITLASNSLVGSSNLLTKIYFPRLIVPTSPCIAGLVDFGIAFLILLAMFPYFAIVPTWTIIFLPLFLLVAFLTALGIGLLLAALNVRYRDVRYAVPFLVQMWMYCTVIVPFSSIPDRFGVWKSLYALNPMVSVVEGFRWCLLNQVQRVGKIVDGQTIQVPVDSPWILLLYGFPIMVLLLLVGFLYFRRTEKVFADIV